MFDKLTDLQFKNFRDLIYNASGIHFTDINRPILENRLRERLRASGKTTLDEYFALIRVDDGELKNLLDAVTTNLTSFFRNKVHFQGFRSYVLPDLKKIKKSQRIKLWSAGCSTGEEPYSLAMVMRDILGPSWTIEIIASDISFNALMKAKEGYYQKNRISGIPPEYISRYMIDMGEGYQVKDDIKKLIRFDYHNLNYDSGIRDVDIVFCRNVIIYFDSKAQESVINKFYNAMTPYSYLFIGHSESLFGMKTKFKFIKQGETCLYMKQES